MFWLIGMAIVSSARGFLVGSQLAGCASLLERPQLQFEQPLVDSEVRYGEPLTLTCSVFGAPQAAIKWFHRGRVVAYYPAPAVESVIHTTRIASGLIETNYFIPCVNRKTLGEYTCEASSPCSDAISSTASVMLSNSATGRPACNASNAAYAPTITVTTVSRLEFGGTPVQLMCRASGFPKPKIAWQRLADDGELEELDTESHMVLSNGDLLVVADPVVATESYRCTARNPAGTATADSTIVFVAED